MRRRKLTQKKFLTQLGILERAEILSKNMAFSEKADIKSGTSVYSSNTVHIACPDLDELDSDFGF